MIVPEIGLPPIEAPLPEGLALGRLSADNFASWRDLAFTRGPTGQYATLARVDSVDNQPNMMEVATPGTMVTCHYCGSPLDSRLYFCPVCATPYKSFRTVLTPSCPAPPSDGELIRYHAPHAWPLFWTYLIVLVVGGVMAALAGRENLAVSEIVMTGAILVTTVVFAIRHWRSLAVQFRQIGFSCWQAWAGLGIVFPLVAVGLAYQALLLYLTGSDSMTSQFEKSGFSQGTMILMIAVCPAILEEIAFRGLLQHWLQAALGPWRGLLLASGLFMALHFSIATAPYLFTVGLLLGWTKWKTGSLYPGMLIHFLHNLIVLEFS